MANSIAWVCDSPFQHSMASRWFGFTRCSLVHTQNVTGTSRLTIFVERCATGFGRQDVRDGSVAPKRKAMKIDHYGFTSHQCFNLLLACRWDRSTRWRMRVSGEVGSDSRLEMFST